LFDQALDKVSAEVVLEGSGVAYGQYRDFKTRFSLLAVLLYTSTHACLLWSACFVLPALGCLRWVDY
jgi:hypothetical protein